MSKRLAVLIAATAMVVGVLAPAAAAQTRSTSLRAKCRSHPAPMIRVGSPLPGLAPLARGLAVQSANWAGYDAVGGGYRSVSATWTQPAVTPDEAQESASAFWVGLDGDGSSSVEQCGTAADNLDGTPRYYAWYEIYPAPEVPISGMTVTPGDVMHGSVVTDGAGHFTLALADETTGVTKTFQQQNAKAEGYSAEVIAEAPSEGQSVLPLADFGSVSFSDCEIDGAPLASAPWELIDMVDPSSSATLAAPSALGADGASFSVTCDVTPPPARPTLASFSPVTGPVGTVVTLAGTGLAGATAVSFAGKSASFTVDSDTQIAAIVPLAARSGRVAVTTPAGTATRAATYTVVPVMARLTLKLAGLRRGVLQLGKHVTISARLSPSRLAGSRVRFTLERRQDRRWRQVLTRVLMSGHGGACSTTSKPGRRGIYRVRVRISKTGANKAAASRRLRFIVK